MYCIYVNSSCKSSSSSSSCCCLPGALVKHVGSRVGERFRGTWIEIKRHINILRAKWVRTFSTSRTCVKKCKGSFVLIFYSLYTVNTIYYNL